MDAMPPPEFYSSYASKPPEEEYFRLRPEEPRPLYFAQNGLAAVNGVTPSTLAQAIREAAARHGNETALAVEIKAQGSDAPGEWKKWTWKDYYDDANKFAKALLSVGTQPFEGVTIWGFNAPEWVIAFVGATIAGAVPAGIYPTDTGDTVAFKNAQIDARVAVVHSRAHLDKMRERIRDMPRLTHVVVYREEDAVPAITGEVLFESDGSSSPARIVRALSWTAFLQQGARETSDDALVERERAVVLPESCACVVFTSGTTGKAKACQLSHDNLNFCFKAVLNRLSSFAATPALAERTLSYLPLSHVAALQMDVVGPVYTAASRDGNASVYFARPTDLKSGKLVERMRDVRPTIFLGVPLVWERMKDRLQQIGAQTHGLKKRLLAWAKAKAFERALNEQMGGSGNLPFMHAISEAVVGKIRERLGLDQCRHAVTGAAPIARSTLEFFAGLGIDILEGYGASESSGVISINYHTKKLWGSIGPALEGCEVRIFDLEGKPVPFCKDLFNPEEREQGEICFRGRNVMLGYMAAKDGSDRESLIKKNKETITKDGWCKTGDKGCMDARGLLRFTGRFKELIKGKGGEIIAPVPIEEAILNHAQALSKVVIIGDQRDFNVALCTLQQEGANGESPGTGVLSGLAREVSAASQTTEQAMRDPVWHDYIRRAIQAANANEKVCLNRAFRIKRFTILPRDFSIERDENTPTLKFKRSVIEHNYAPELARLYDAFNGSTDEQKDEITYVLTSGDAEAAGGGQHQQPLSNKQHSTLPTGVAQHTSAHQSESSAGAKL